MESRTVEVSILIDPCISWTRRSDEIVFAPRLEDETDVDALERREVAPLSCGLDDVETEDVDFAFFFLKGSELRVDDGTEVVVVFVGGPPDPESKVVVSSSNVSLRFDVEADMRVEASPSLSTSIASLLA
jgi:hypothetical protein